MFVIKTENLLAPEMKIFIEALEKIRTISSKTFYRKTSFI